MDTINKRLKLGFHSKKEWKDIQAIFTKDTLLMGGHQIMQRWETNYMKMLSSIVIKNGGKILELGYGLGISAKFIQYFGRDRIKEHIIIEMHPEVTSLAKKNFVKEIKNKRVKVINNYWENVTKKFSNNSFDGILFDTYPLNLKQIHKNHYDFFKEAYRILKKGGIFTYYSDEYKNFSKEHIKKLKQAGFTKISYKICKIKPPKNCIYWNKSTILAPIIIK